MDFEAELAKFLGQPSMKASMQKTAIAAMKAGNSGTADSLAEAQKWVDQARAAIVASLPISLKRGSYHNITEKDLVATYVGMSDDGKFQFELAWNPDAVWRYSLYSPDDLSGIDDIVALLENGTSPNKRKVWGKWHSRSVYLPQGWSRTPGKFLDTCINWFNIKHQADGVTLRLSSKAEWYR